MAGPALRAASPYLALAAAGGAIGYGAAGMALGTDDPRQQAGWGAMSVIGGAAAGAGIGAGIGALGGPIGAGAGAIISGVAGGVVGTGRMAYEAWRARRQARETEQGGEAQAQELRGRGYLDPEEQWRRVRAGEHIGRPAGSIRTEMEQARPPAAVQQLQDWRADLQRTLKELPNWIKQGQQEAMRQQQQQLKLDVSGTVTPSPMFGVLMQYQVSLDVLRSVQVAVS